MYITVPSNGKLAVLLYKNGRKTWKIKVSQSYIVYLHHLARYNHSWSYVVTFSGEGVRKTPWDLKEHFPSLVVVSLTEFSGTLL